MQAIRELEALGAEFVKKRTGEIDVFLAPAHSCRRSVRVAGGGTARLMGPLSDGVRRQSIALHEGTMALEILQRRGRSAGVVAIRREELLLFRSKTIVLASGGAGRIYPLTSNMEESTGDGHAMAMRNRLALTGMEFVQFTPTALAYPKLLEGTSTGGVLLGLPGTRLWNKRNERFMEGYDPERKEACVKRKKASVVATKLIAGVVGYADNAEHVPATHDATQGRQDARLLATGALGSPRTQGGAGNGGATRRTRCRRACACNAARTRDHRSRQREFARQPVRQ